MKFQKDEIEDIIKRRSNGDPITDAELKKLVSYWDTVVDVVGAAINVFGKGMWYHAIHEQSDAHRVRDARKGKGRPVVEEPVLEEDPLEKAIAVLKEEIDLQNRNFKNKSYMDQCYSYNDLETYRKNIRLSIDLLRKKQKGVHHA